MKTLKQKIEVMAAALDGKGIEKLTNGEWSQLFTPPDKMSFDWNSKDYRVKQEPMEYWVDVYTDGDVEIASDKNRRLYKGRSVEKMVKMREVTE